MELECQSNSAKKGALARVRERDNPMGMIVNAAWGGEKEKRRTIGGKREKTGTTSKSKPWDTNQRDGKRVGCAISKKEDQSNGRENRTKTV